MSGDEQSRKSSVRNNIMIAFFLLILLGGITFTIFFQNVLHGTLQREGLMPYIIVDITRQFTVITTGLSLAAIVVGLFVALLLSRPITRPIKELIRGTAEVARGNLDTRIEIESQDEFGELAEDFNHMTVSLKTIMKELEETTAAKERIESELKVAHDIQMGILPKIFPPFPERQEIEIYATLEPAKEVGGDFYDFFFIDDEHLCFAIGDVSGKGVPAALFMAISRTLVKMKATQGLTSDAVLTRVNQDLSLDNPSLMFVTLFCGILNIHTGELEYSNGGHCPPFVLRTDGKVEELELTEGVPLGVMQDFSFKSKRILLKDRETIFLYSDGVTEAMNTRDEFFSDQRLEKSLAEKKDRSIREIVAGITEEISLFCAGADQTDDIAIMALQYRGVEK